MTQKSLKLFSKLFKNFSITKLKLFFLNLEHYAQNAKLQKKVEKYFGLFKNGQLFLSIFKKSIQFSEKSCTFALLQF